jgi:cell wall-associated NlpC family hydrolase
MKKSVIMSVAPLRREPSDKSEMVSQALFGERVEVLEEQQKWSMVRMEADGYEGWIDNKQLGAISNESEMTTLRNALTRCTLDNGTEVWLPAGAMVSSHVITDSIQEAWNGSATDIERCALQFLNAPYLWGGRTVLGIDCSGFTQLVMRLNGITLPRDAYQQAELGNTINFVEEAQTGDLAFFDNSEGRIVHVGIVLMNSNAGVTIIHASGCVRIDSLDHQGIFNQSLGEYTHKLRIIKRVL